MRAEGARSNGNRRRRQRALSPAAGFLIAAVVTLFLAIVIGVLVGSIVADPGPEAEFQWSESGEGEALRITLEHVEGESINGSRLTLEAEGIRGLSGESTLDDWGTVRNGSTLTVGFVADANLEDGRVNGTDEEDGTDVIAVAVEGSELAQGTVLVRGERNEDGDLEDVDIRDLRTLTLTWSGTFQSAELDEYTIDR